MEERLRKVGRIRKEKDKERNGGRNKIKKCNKRTIGMAGGDNSFRIEKTSSVDFYYVVVRLRIV